MSTPVSTDLIMVERSGTVYKETKANYDTAVGGGGGGGGEEDAEYGVAIQFCWGQLTAGYHSSGTSRHDGGTMYYHRTDSAGTYYLSSSATSSQSYRPGTQLKIDGTWYTINTWANTTSATQPGPVNVYYRRQVMSWAFSPSEVATATGAESGSIQGLKINIAALPSSSYNSFPDFQIGMKLISGGNNTSNYSGTTGGSYTQVYSADPKVWSSTSWQGVDFSTNIAWT